MAANWQDHQLVVDKGAEGTYDTTHANEPCIIKDGSTYKMWYSGYNGTNWRTIYCTSTNGTTWTGHTLVIDLSAEGTYDTSRAYTPAVIKDGETYKMWYSGWDSTNWRIIYCTSANGTTWTGHTMVLDKGAEGTYDTVGSIYPAVIKDGSTYKMWYTGYNGSNERIIYSTSTNGTTWTGHTLVINLSAEGTYDTSGANYASVIKDGATYKMWYSGNDGPNHRAIYCTSTNGTTWTGHTLSINIGAEGTYDTSRIFAPFVIKDGNIYKVWYAGNDGTFNRIIYARDVSEVPPIPTIVSINGVLIENIAKISTVDIANISKVIGIEALLGTGGIGGIDEYTKLMLHMDGDQSDSNHAVTTNGNPQLNSTTKKFGASSMQFDGTGDYLSIPDSGDWDVGAGAFAVDFWLYFTSVTGDLGLFGYGPGNDFFAYTRSSDNTINFVLDAGAGGHLARTWAPSTSTWYHVALTREGSNGDFRWFIDGSQLGSSYVDARTITDYTGAYILGANPDANANWLSGYIDEFRFSKGVSRWTSNFSVPTAPYTSDANTKLLLHFNGDESNSGHEVTFNGDPQISATTAKFDGAYYFDGTGDYLSIPDSDDWTMGDGDFTIDFWIYPTDAGGDNMLIQFSSGSGSDNVWYVQIYQNTMYFTVRQSASTILQIVGSSTINNNTWYHIAVVRDGNTVYMYVNGNSDGSDTAVTIADESNDVGIGSNRLTGETTDYSGYMDEVRISKGIARWTSNFTPPTSPYTRINMTNGIDEYTKLMLHMDGINNGTDFPDSSSSAHTITRTGNPKTVTAVKKFGTASCDFIPGAENLNSADSADWDFGDADFTIDYWYKLNVEITTGPTADVRRVYSAGLESNNLEIFFGTRGKDGDIQFNFGTYTGSYTQVYSDPITMNIAAGWYHCAVVRDGSFVRFFLNGTLISSAAWTTTVDADGPLLIGCRDISGTKSEFIKDYVDELRISKGIARWTSNFTPPVSPYS